MPSICKRPWVLLLVSAVLCGCASSKMVQQPDLGDLGDGPTDAPELSVTDLDSGGDGDGSLDADGAPEFRVPDLYWGEGVPCGGKDCNDHLICTKDTCLADNTCSNTLVSGWCVIKGACYKDGDVDPKSQCLACDTATSTTLWTEDVSLCKDDGLVCTKEFCSSGTCSSSLVSGFCLANNTCYKDGKGDSSNECLVCDTLTTTKALTPLQDGSACTSDGLSCTDDVCKTGVCTHAVKAGLCLISGTCHLNGAANPSSGCQSCVPSKSQTAWSSAADGTACTDDLLACTTDACKAGACAHTPKTGYCLISGACVASGAVNPTSDCKSCVPSKSQTAWSTATDGTSCTTDNLACTTDACKAGTCAHTLTAGYCLIAGACVAQGAVSPTVDCKQCLPGVSNSTWSQASDGTACSSDGLSCTDDVCSAGACAHKLKANTCKIGGACYNSGAQSPSQACMTCNPAQNQNAWSAAQNGAPCADDGLFCTQDTCQGGQCNHTLMSNHCLIGGQCYVTSAQNPQNACMSCNPGSNPNAWSPAANNMPCTSDGLFCTNDICLGGQCTHPLLAGFCKIGGQCFTKGDAQPGGGCSICQPSKSDTSWTPVSYAGCCDGQVVRYCESGTLMQIDCAVNPLCGWSNVYYYYDCGTNGAPGPAGYPKEC